MKKYQNHVVDAWGELSVNDGSNTISTSEYVDRLRKATEVAAERFAIDVAQNALNKAAKETSEKVNKRYTWGAAKLGTEIRATEIEIPK